MDEKFQYLLIGSLLGWFLGLFSPMISSFIMRIYQKGEIKKGIYNELNEVKLRMAMAVSLLAPHFTPYNRELLTWLQPYLEEYDRFYPGKNFSQRNKTILEGLTDDQFKAMTVKEILEKPQPGYHLKQYYLPFLECHMVSLAIFDAEFQRKLMEIRTQISLLNEEISLSRFYFEKTFDNISENNYRIITNNISETYQNVARTLRRIVDKIDKLVEP